VLGEAEIAQVFDITIKRRQNKPIAGCKIRNGTVSINAEVRVLRGGKTVFDGKLFLNLIPSLCQFVYLRCVTGTLESLKNVKKDVTEMRKGSECGMSFEGWNDFQVGDQVQSYEIKEEKRYL
jgi:translation initiation factor IF-2